MQKTDPLIRTKLRLPFIRPDMVSRSRLQEQIDQGLRGPLTLITAPAGFGKTTLAATAIAGRGLPVAWLSLDKDDNQSGRFLRYLVAALQGVDPAIGNRAAQLLMGAQQAALETILTSLINDLDAARKEIVLVLDDYQFISSRDVHEQLAFMLDHCPGTLHLVIVTRSDPPLHLARLHGRGQMVELRAADLRFTSAEAGQFLNGVMNLRLDNTSVALLAERTEGWITGLQMAALSMRDRKDIAGFIEGFSGTNRYILDYLLEEVLANQPPELQCFLLCTSILERLTARLCDAILKDEIGGLKDGLPYLQTSSFILEHLERANLFLMPLDDERQWYRYHHLFADLLRARLDQTYPGMAPQLHLRAAAWYEQNGLTLDAIQHASQASDDQMVERLIEQNYLQMMNRDEMSLVRFWLGKLRKELVYRRPWLCLYEAMNRSWFGQLDEAVKFLNEAEKGILAKSPAEISTPGVQAMLGYHAYVKSRVTAMQGDTLHAIEFCRTARTKVPVDNLALQIDFSITLGYEYFLYGDFANASRTLNETIQMGYQAGAVNNPVAAYALLARLQVYRGRLHEAQDLLQKATGLMHGASGQFLGVFGLVEVETAALLCEWNDLDAALVHLMRGMDNLPSWGKTDDTCLACTVLARIQLARGNQAEAAAAIEKAAQLVNTRGVFSEARSAVETAQVKLWLAQGNGPAAERWAAVLKRRLEPTGQFRYEDEPAHIMQARVFLARGKPDRAVGLLAGVEKAARSDGRLGRLIEILILKALARQQVGDSTSAEAALVESLALAEPEGYQRIFLDEGQPVQALLAQWLARDGAAPMQEYARRVLAGFEKRRPGSIEVMEETLPMAGQAETVFRIANHSNEPGPRLVNSAAVDPKAQPAGSILVEPLSQRELEVLSLMALGNTNREIAEQLVISPGTVKAHTASIYRKLDVANRTEAAARARDLGIFN